jgi:argininosuccinate lyase
MKPLWKKSWTDTDDEVLAFTVGNDPELDQQLIPFDIIGSIAHAKGLHRIGLLSEQVCADLCRTLSALHHAHETGAFRIEAGEEDMHTAIERALTEELGDAGKRIHIGRSRNDQVLTALRLYMKTSLLDLMAAVFELAKTACKEGEKYRRMLMPGYTHMQRAMPATVGFWYASFAEAWADALAAGQALFQRLDRSPLGAAAGFGVPLPLDRPFTAALMGFGAVHVNAAAVQNSRGRLEGALLSWIVEVGRDIEKLSWDLLLFSSAEFGFVAIPESLVTGSSIMPQKKNPDIIELLRASPGVVRGCRDEVERIIEKLPSNYHRDFQLTKDPLMRGVTQGMRQLGIAKKLIQNLAWRPDSLRRACSTELFATHRAVELTKSGLPFRDAYGQAAVELKEGDTNGWCYSDDEIINGLGHLGAPGNPGLDEAAGRVTSVEKWVSETRTALFAKWEALLRSE